MIVQQKQLHEHKFSFSGHPVFFLATTYMISSVISLDLFTKQGLLSKNIVMFCQKKLGCCFENIFFQPVEKKLKLSLRFSNKLFITLTTKIESIWNDKLFYMLFSMQVFKKCRNRIWVWINRSWGSSSELFDNTDDFHEPCEDLELFVFFQQHFLLWCILCS